MDLKRERLWLALQTITSGNRELLKLLRISSDPEEILDAPAPRWQAVGVGSRAVETRAGWRGRPWSEAGRQQEQLRRMEALTLAVDSADYPPLLREIADPPALLFVRGDPGCLRQAYMAVVGSRNSSLAGRRATAEICGELVAAGLGICSGLALGIDAAAHQATLAADGLTVAVMATGPDQLYPARHRGLAAEICRRGALLTEFPLGSPPIRERFPQRNRIISGLSLGVLVVEAAQRSGSLITARLALEQNREVFALPHSIYHFQGRGCNALLKDGAHLVQTSADILQQLDSMAGALRELQPRPQPQEVELSAVQKRILQSLGDAPLGLDELVAVCAVAAEDLLTQLTELQLQGLVENRDGRYCRG